MPVVGQAIVVVRVRSNNLRNDIRDAVNDGFAGADRDIDRAGARTGDRFNASVARAIREDKRLEESIRNNVERGLREDRRLDLAAQRLGHDIHASFAQGLRDDRRLDLESEALGERMAARMESALRDNERLRLAGARINQQVADGVRRDRALELAFAREARLAAGSIDREVHRSRPRLLNLFGSTGGNLAKKFRDEFNLGIGAARMGPVVSSALILALPEFVGAAAAVGVAGAGALTAALSSALLSGGLLAAAFASGAESLKAGKDLYGTLGKNLGTRIADGMANGFQASAQILTDRLLPAIEGPLTKAGEAFGSMFENLANVITLPENLARIGSILDTNNVFIERFSLGLNGLTTSFLILFKASKPMIDLVGARFQEFGEWAANALAAAEANGSLGIVMEKLTVLASALFDWIGKIGPAFGNWLLNLDVDRIIGLWDSFGRVLSGVFDIFAEIGQGAGPIMPQILANIADILENMVNSGVIEKFAASVAGMVEAFTGFVAVLSDNPIVAQLLAFGVAWLLIGRIFSPIITLVQALVGGLGALAAPILLVAGVIALLWTQSENFRNSISGVVEAVSGKFMEIWDKLAPKIQPLIDAVLRFGEALGNFLAPIIERIGPIFLGLLDIIGTVLGFIIDQVTLFFTFLADILSGDFEGAWEAFKQMWVNLYNFIGELFTKLRLWLGEIFTQLWEWLLSVFQGIWDQITETAATVWQNLVNWFHIIWDPIAAWWSALWESIVAWFNMVWAQITAVAQATWTALVTAFHFFWDPIVQAWNTIWLAVETVFSVVWGLISSIAQTTWQALVTAFHTIVDPIVAWWSNTWETVKATAEGVWNAIVSVASSTWNTITSTITQIVSDFASTLEGWWNTITGAVEAAWTGLSAIVSGIWNGVKDAIVGPIEDAYGLVTGWIENIKGVVQGVIDWLGARVEDVKNAVSEAVSAANSTPTTVSGVEVGPGLSGLSGNYVGSWGAALTALASGGLVTRPTLALVGEAGPERVTPLDADGLSTRDRVLISTIVNSMLGQVGQGGGGSTTVQVRIGEREIDDYIARQVDDRNDVLARQVSRRRR